MKNTLAKLGIAITITSIWAAALTQFGVWLFRNYSVNPSFPYYYVLLVKLRDAAYALWGYFDGVHYLRLIEYGYVDTGTQAFFPLYPLLARALSISLGLNAYVTGIIISLLALAVSLLVLWQLDPKRKFIQTCALLFFPTSFFLIGLYTESLFLLLSLAFFLSLKKESYLIASLLAGLASSTRLVGVFLGFVLVWRLLTRYKTTRPFYTLSLASLSLSGFIGYSYFLWSQFGDPLMFLHVQEMFGAGRSGGELILLPQVLYRYTKMVFTVDPSTFLYQRIWLELIFFIGAVYAWFKNLKFQKPEINLYIILSLLLPTLTGTLSSIPRYVLVLVPFLLPYNMKKPTYFLLLTFNFLLMLYLFSHFTHGTFVA